MEIQEVSELISNGIDKIINKNDYKSILNRKNNLIRYNYINRILICIQNKNAYDLKTAKEWYIEGRNIRKNQKPLYIILPKYKSEYIDTETGNKLEKNDLNIDEINKALEYNIIQKVDSIENVYVASVFDIRQTYSSTDVKYSINKPKLNTSNIIKLFCDITECNIEKDEEIYYSSSENTLYIKKCQYKELVSTISKLLSQYYINNKLDNIISNTLGINKNNLSEFDIDLIKDSITYAISTLLGVEVDIDFYNIADIQINNVLLALNITDYIIFEIISRLEFSSEAFNLDASHNINIMNKAEAILNIAEANLINKKIRGI